MRLLSSFALFAAAVIAGIVFASVTFAPVIQGLSR